MAAVKLLANINNTAGNTGVYNPIFTFKYFVTGLPAAVTAVPVGVVPCDCTYVGCAVALKTPPSSGTITVQPLKFVAATAASADPAALNTTDPAIASTAGVTHGPASTMTITKELVTSTVHTGATGITDAVLATGAAAELKQGDQVLVTTSGTFTTSAGLAVTLFFRDNSGSV